MENITDNLEIPKPRLTKINHSQSSLSCLVIKENRSPLRLVAQKRNIQASKKIRLTLPKEDGEPIATTPVKEVKPRRKSHDENASPINFVQDISLDEVCHPKGQKRATTPIRIRPSKRFRPTYIESLEPIPEGPIFAFL